MKFIGKEKRFSHYPDTLITTMGRDRNSMVDSFVDEAVRFYCIMNVYPSFPVEEAMELAMRPDRYEIVVRSIEEASRSSEWRAKNPHIPPTTEGWLVSITEVKQ
tara:strand:+ start:1865 stop:2176 length:312 start_codon:yes stop_codon:yes gene_type:complete